MKKVLIILSILIIIAAGIAIYKNLPQKEKTIEETNNSGESIQYNNSKEESNFKDPSKGTIVSIDDLKGKKVLVEKHYLNYAFSFDHEGIIICTDGTIYNFKYSNEDELSPTPYEKIIEESDDIITHVTTFEGRVSSEDLESLTSLLEKVEEDYESKNVAMDAGEDTILYYNYDKNTKITLQSAGDSIVKNNSKNVKKILSILDSYHIRIDE